MSYNVEIGDSVKQIILNNAYRWPQTPITSSFVMPVGGSIVSPQILPTASYLQIPIERENWQKHLSPAKDSSVEGLLTSIGLPMYADVLRDKGYTSVQRIMCITDSELEAMNVKSNHREIILNYMRTL